MTTLGLDLHGVIDSNPEFFMDFTRWLKKENETKILIISGPPKSHIEDDLARIEMMQGENFDEIISVVDYLKRKNVEMWRDKKQNWWAKDEDWWSSKSEICKINNVTSHIDDSEKYGCWFAHETMFFLWEEGINYKYGMQNFSYWRHTWGLETHK